MAGLQKHRNHGLFSDYFLNELLPQQYDEWSEEETVKDAFQQVKQLYENQKYELPNKSEAQLEDEFIQKILTILGHVREVQPTLVGKAIGTKRPDYALFPNEEDKAEAQEQKGTVQYFQRALALVEAKKWERSLDKEIKGLDDKDNPSLQMDRYLYYTEVSWGILTNGRYWRLYYHKTSKELDNYFETDLQDILENEDLEAFKYFYFLFRRQAFPEFVKQVYQGSVDYAEKLGYNLKANVYEALKVLARGFLHYPHNGLNAESNLEQIHDNCLILLYRIIFLLYAESPRRGERLLPLDDPTYRDTYSFYALKNRVAEQIDNNAELSPIKVSLWSDLTTLFSLVNKGSEHVGIPRSEFVIPSYNGGLFDEEEHAFLEKYQIADTYLARAVDLLARTPIQGDKAFADYSSLDIRDLGSIYEGLLEFRLDVAEQDLVAIKERGKQKWVPAAKANESNILEAVSEGELYLRTDENERKATGSYYTPDYIVEYIVENTLGPIIEERREAVDGDDAKLIDEILDLKVLDPAMGSGHFLVGAIDFLARELLKALEGSSSDQNGNGNDEEDMRWARREIVERCVFGVDVNPLAVELAKLSLWLTTVSKDKPLSFLDHHLRCGNSLIGAWTKDLGSMPQHKKKDNAQTSIFDIQFKKNIKTLLDVFERIEQTPSDSLEDVEEKKQTYYEEFRPLARQFMDVAHVWTSIYFDNEVDVNAFTKLQNALTDHAEWKTLEKESWFVKARELAASEKFFHWELEFPEIWFEDGGIRKGGGFDAVIGNPPYVSAWSMTEGEEYNTLRRVIENLMPDDDVLDAHWDLYIPFLLRAYDVTKQNGRFSFIIPNPFCREKYAAKPRHYLLSHSQIERLVSFGKENVFGEVSRQTLVPVIRKARDKSFYHDIKIDDPSSVISQDAPKNYGDRTIPQETFLELPGYQWRHEMLREEINILQKMDERSIRVGNLCYVNYGAQVSSKERGAFKKEDVVHTSPQGNAKPFFEGRHLKRYEIRDPGLYLDYRPNEMYGPRVPEFFENSKIAIRHISGENETIIVALDENHLYCDHGIVLAVPYSKVAETQLRTSFEGFEQLSSTYDMRFMLAILASKLVSYYYRQRFATGSLQGSYSHVYPQHVRNLPIPELDALKESDEAAKSLSHLSTMYDKGDMVSVLDEVKQLLQSKDTVAAESTRKSLHDFLSLLGEAMMQLKRDYWSEQQGFLNWLEEYLGADLEDLKNKTKLKSYEGLFTGKFLGIIDQNTRIIAKDTDQRDNRERLKSEFQSSLSRLKPLRERLQQTDWLIDQIVYKLYGLTDEEIKLVDESFKDEDQ